MQKFNSLYRPSSPLQKIKHCNNRHSSSPSLNHKVRVLTATALHPKTHQSDDSLEFENRNNYSQWNNVDADSTDLMITGSDIVICGLGILYDYNEHRKYKRTKIHERKPTEAKPKYKYPIYPQLYEAKGHHKIGYVISDLEQVIIHGKPSYAEQWNAYIGDDTLPPTTKNPYNKTHNNNNYHDDHIMIYRPLLWNLLDIMNCFKSQIDIRNTICTKVNITNDSSINPKLINDVYTREDLRSDKDSEHEVRCGNDCGHQHINNHNIITINTNPMYYINYTKSNYNFNDYNSQFKLSYGYNNQYILSNISISRTNNWYYYHNWYHLYILNKVYGAYRVPAKNNPLYCVPISVLIYNEQNISDINVVIPAIPWKTYTGESWIRTQFILPTKHPPDVWYNKHQLNHINIQLTKHPHGVWNSKYIQANPEYLHQIQMYSGESGIQKQLSMQSTKHPHGVNNKLLMITSGDVPSSVVSITKSKLNYILITFFFMQYLYTFFFFLSSSFFLCFVLFLFYHFII